MSIIETSRHQGKYHKLILLVIKLQLQDIHMQDLNASIHA